MRLRSLPSLRRQLAAAVDLTLWCLGCDVRHPAGNLLMERGLRRVRPPAGSLGATTMYAAGGGDHEARFAAWGFGLFLGCPVRGVGLLLRRHDAAGARLTAAPALAAPVWTPDALPHARPVLDGTDAAHAAALLAALARHVAAHERWVAECCGAAYRTACVTERPRHVRRRHRLGPDLAPAWDAAAAGYAALACPPAAPHDAAAA
jgi:hypothetical protein